jgi:hypothetical protein
MGMYDEVNFEMKCPLCKYLLEDFQSKSGNCTLSNLELYAVDDFYTTCDNCNLWIRFEVERKPIASAFYFIIKPVYMDMQQVKQSELEEWTKKE